MTIEHKNLTGSDLHEPKGADTASSNQVYHADGVGSGSWSDPLSRVNNLNTFDLTLEIGDISTAGANTMLYVPRACTLTKVATVIDAPITMADAVISIYKNAVLQGQTLTVAYSGSAKGITDLLTLSPTYSFAAGDYIELRSDGGSTDACKAYVTLTFTV